MRDVLTKATTEAAQGLVRGIAQQLGVPLAAEQVAELAAEGLKQLAGAISTAAWKDARGKGDAAADSITTLEQAEASARGKR